MITQPVLIYETVCSICWRPPASVTYCNILAPVIFPPCTFLHGQLTDVTGKRTIISFSAIHLIKPIFCTVTVASILCRYNTEAGCCTNHCIVEVPSEPYSLKMVHMAGTLGTFFGSQQTNLRPLKGLPIDKSELGCTTFDNIHKQSCEEM